MLKTYTICHLSWSFSDAKTIRARDNIHFEDHIQHTIQFDYIMDIFM